MADILPGQVLIADPFLKDPNFMRTVVFMCEHQPEGSFGFVINKPYIHPLGQLVEDLDGVNMPVYYGGPVQTNTLHFLHRSPALINGGIKVTDDIYWGGEFEQVKNLIRQNKLSHYNVRFFVGYSGWGEGQLNEEIKENTWVTGNGNASLVFNQNIDMIWKEALRQKGGAYAQMIHYPIDPQLN